MLAHAFKEWAVVCEALALGQQAIILRKGGIDETGGEFGVEHTRFWLYPTYTHQQNFGINAETRPLLEQVELQRPPAGILRLSLWAELTGIYRLRDVLPALMLSHLHCWSDEAVRKRFEYRAPGLNVLMVRVYRAPQVHDIEELPAYEGCRSWVTLQTALPTEESTPILDDASYRVVQKQLDMLLTPTALA
jgi:hypothetical protein